MHQIGKYSWQTDSHELDNSLSRYTTAAWQHGAEGYSNNYLYASPHISTMQRAWHGDPAARTMACYLELLCLGDTHHCRQLGIAAAGHLQLCSALEGMRKASPIAPCFCIGK